jgi:hypothetical protein
MSWVQIPPSLKIVFWYKYIKVLKNIYFPSFNYIIVRKNKKNKEYTYISKKNSSKYEVESIHSKFYGKNSDFISSKNYFDYKKFIIESR